MTLLVFAAPVAAEEVTAFAAASLTDALKDVAQGFEAKTGHKVVFNLGASNDLARQIRAGALADVFFSADKAQMDGLEAAGLVRAANRVDVLSNVPVVVVPVSSSTRISQPTDLLAVKHLALADPEAVRPRGHRTPPSWPSLSSCPYLQLVDFDHATESIIGRREFQRLR
jgi:molybdate transport system substrate-binding protein